MSTKLRLKNPDVNHLKQVLMQNKHTQKSIKSFLKNIKVYLLPLIAHNFFHHFSFFHCLYASYFPLGLKSDRDHSFLSRWLEWNNSFLIFPPGNVFTGHLIMDLSIITIILWLLPWSLVLGMCASQPWKIEAKHVLNKSNIVLSLLIYKCRNEKDGRDEARGKWYLYTVNSPALHEANG